MQDMATWSWGTAQLILSAQWTSMHRKNSGDSKNFSQDVLLKAISNLVIRNISDNGKFLLLLECLLLYKHSHAMLGAECSPLLNVFNAQISSKETKNLMFSLKEFFAESVFFMG